MGEKMSKLKGKYYLSVNPEIGTTETLKPPLLIKMMKRERGRESRERQKKLV